MIKTNSTHHIALSKALIQLETDMYQDGIWPNEEPSEQDLNNAMESAVPFAVDCLAFESWLAFIFYSQNARLVDAGTASSTYANYACSANIPIIGESAHPVSASSY